MKNKFISKIRLALGSTSKVNQASPLATPIYDDANVPFVQNILRGMKEKEDELLDQLSKSAKDIGWQVKVANSNEEAAEHVLNLVLALNVDVVMRSAHPVIDHIELESSFRKAGIQMKCVSVSNRHSNLEEQRKAIRETAINTEIGITGVDFAIAETGSCAIAAKPGVSRLVALLPRTHIAIVRKGQVVPNLDEFFALRRQELVSGNSRSYMNIISGPSRSADIEQTIVQGVHGPGNTHMVLIN